MALSEFRAAINQVATERGIPVDEVLDSIRTALASAYKKDYDEELKRLKGETQPKTPTTTETEEKQENPSEEEEQEEISLLTVDLNEDTGEAKILFDGKDVTPSGFGRIAAQTAKQVILQKIRETEKRVILEEFEDKVDTIVMGTIFKIEDNGKITLDLGKAHGVMPLSESVKTENYRINQRIKVYVKDVKSGTRGTEVIVSRSDPNFVVKLFEQEVPEIASGVVEIKGIAREAGSRTKMAVISNDEKIDPVGSCVGQKGVRVQSIISELFGEKIDIIPWSPQIEKFIAASLSPARVTDVVINEEENKATVSVPEDQQSLAIGKEGQNARLANKLTKWKIDIKGAVGIFDTDENGDATSDTGVVGVWDAAIAKVNAQAQEEETKKEQAGEIDESEEKGTAGEENSDEENSEDKEETTNENADEENDIDEKEKIDEDAEEKDKEDKKETEEKTEE